MSGLAVELEDISDDEQPTRNVSTDAPVEDLLAKFAGVEDESSSKLEKDATKNVTTPIDNETPCSVEKNNEQSWKTIEVCK